MKPLKDIGHRVEPSPHSLTRFEPYTVYHDVERRELVRRVYAEGFRVWLDEETSLTEEEKIADALLEADKFISEHGL